MDPKLRKGNSQMSRAVPGPVFIVSTGRCGSTMLSDMVNRHPDMLSLSEFLASLSSKALRGRRMTGDAMYRRLGTLSPGGRALLANGLQVDEFLYPLGPEARYRAHEVPPILCATLPHLTADHEALWDELSAALRTRGPDTPAAHYRFVFDWLARRFRRRVWLERSGGSLLLVPALARLFPDARFVHLYRDGRDTAISMHRHHYFRLRVQAAQRMAALGIDPFHPFNVPGTSPWMPMLESLRFRFFDAERYRRTEIGLPAFGWFWSGMIERGMRHLDALPPERVLSMRYETVLESPRAEMTRFIRFVAPDLEDRDWLDLVSAMPRAGRSRLDQFDRATQERLKAACEPGARRLGYSARNGTSEDIRP